MKLKLFRCLFWTLHSSLKIYRDKFNKFKNHLNIEVLIK